MGEITRWRVTRGPQRKVPSDKSLIWLQRTPRIGAGTQKRLASIPGGVPVDPKALGAAVPRKATKTLQISPYVAYLGVLQDPNNLRSFLKKGTPAAPPSQATPASLKAAAALMQLDDWLAANAPLSIDPPPYSTPATAGLDQQITELLGTYLPNSATWRLLQKTLNELFFAGLILSAMGGDISLTTSLGLLNRWLLVASLVDDLQLSQSPIQTADDVYAALRWRTLVLPDNITAILAGIRANKNAVVVRKAGFADLYITREEWDHYEAAEIASIENILGKETKSRIHVLVNQTTTTTTTGETTTNVKEQDTTTTDQSQLQQQASSDLSIAAHVDGQVDVSGQYGVTQVNSHLGGSLDYSSSSSTSKAVTQSHETVSRAVTKIEKTTMQVRTSSTLTRSTDREIHKFDNTDSSAPVVGVYRWVDQIQNVELDRYPHRFLLEFEVPEPGAWTRWLHLNDLERLLTHKPPIPLTADGKPLTGTNPLLQASDLNVTSYRSIAARYNTAGLSACPQPKVIAHNLTFPAPQTSLARQDVKADATLDVPSGYRAISARATVVLWSLAQQDTTTTDSGTTVTEFDVILDLAVAAAKVQETKSPQGMAVTFEPFPLNGLTDETIPIAVGVQSVGSFSVNLEVTCEPTPVTMAQWQNDTYSLIVGAYSAMLQAYIDEKSALTLQQTNPVDAASPDQNAKTIKQELKRQIIEMLIGTPFTGRSAITWNGVDAPGNAPPNPNLLKKAAAIAPEIQFLEQSFEWETLSYICYPSYWADVSRWPELAVIEGNDSNFADFLRAGSARVVLAARPGFEDQVNFYLQFGILWGGGPMPAPGDPDYLSIADEIKAMQQGPLDVTVIDTWQVRLPTTLIWLHNPIQLPKNPRPTIDSRPRIAGLTPASGAIGSALTVSGRNFGDIEGMSTVSINGARAEPTNWTAHAINVTVPATAATGDVIVTVNGVASAGAKFTVI